MWSYYDSENEGKVEKAWSGGDSFLRWLDLPARSSRVPSIIESRDCQVTFEAQKNFRVDHRINQTILAEKVEVEGALIHCSSICRTS
jgi:hypothetical protein